MTISHYFTSWEIIDHLVRSISIPDTNNWLAEDFGEINWWKNSLHFFYLFLLLFCRGWRNIWCGINNCLLKINLWSKSREFVLEKQKKGRKHACIFCKASSMLPLWWKIMSVAIQKMTKRYNRMIITSVFLFLLKISQAPRLYLSYSFPVHKENLQC